MRIGWVAVAVLAALALFQHKDPVAPLPVSVAQATTLPAIGPYDEVIPGQIVIDVVDTATFKDLRDIGKKVGIHLVPASPFSAVDKVEVAQVDPEQQEAILTALARDPRVEGAEPNRVYRALFTPNDPRFSEQWNMQQIRAPGAWDVTRGRGITVAVIDTGVAFERHNHFYQVEDLAGCEFVHPYNFLTGDTHANDDNGHGTHVAGTIRQTTHNGIGVAGIAPECKIMPLKCLSAGGAGSLAHIAQAIRYAADNGAQVINMSLGGPYPSRVLQQACEYAKKKGTIVVCAAGNDGKDTVSYPGAYAACMAVSATRRDQGIAFYSNYGKGVAIAAPGGDTRNDGPAGGILQNCIDPKKISQQGYFAFQGTSMACPHVAGAAALVMSMGVTDPNAVQKILQDTAQKMKGTRQYGAGILDCQAAVEAAKGSGDLWRLAVAFALTLGTVLFVPTRARWLGFRFVAGVVISSCGILVITGLPGVTLPYHDYLASGLPQWGALATSPDSVVDWAFHSALIPIALVLLCLGFTGWRPLLAGLALGFSAHLAAAAFAPVGVLTAAAWWKGAWMAGNAAICWVLAGLVLSGMESSRR
jgi:serine protease